MLALPLGAGRILVNVPPTITAVATRVRSRRSARPSVTPGTDGRTQGGETDTITSLGHDWTGTEEDGRR